MRLDHDTCYRALAARDPRFDGLFFVGVETTGIYCRPVCTARTPRRDRCSFHGSAAAAEKAGFRACFVCRPELAPGLGTVDAIPRLVASAVARIEEGFLDRAGVDALAAALGVSARHLRRAMQEELGVSPAELAQTRRLATARRLLADSALSITEIALASGYGSVRRFHAAFAARFGRPPSAVRRAAAAAPGTLALRLDYRPPLDWERLLRFLRVHATPGVEEVSVDAYRRVLRIGEHVGTLRAWHDGDARTVRLEASTAFAPVLPALIARARRLFDLDARPDRVLEAFAADPALAPAARRRPGLRIPGSMDAFETTVRAVLGQQVSVVAGTTLAGRLVARFGAALPAPEGALTHRFPAPAELVARSPEAIAAIGMPRARGATIVALAHTFGATAAPSREALLALPGIGPWTVEYVAARGFADPDAFPASDLAIRRALGGATAAEATRRAEPWRPWRSYAAVHLWAAMEEGDLP